MSLPPSLLFFPPPPFLLSPLSRPFPLPFLLFPLPCLFLPPPSPFYSSPHRACFSRRDSEAWETVRCCARTAEGVGSGRCGSSPPFLSIHSSFRRYSRDGEGVRADAPLSSLCRTSQREEGGMGRRVGGASQRGDGKVSKHLTTSARRAGGIWHAGKRRARSWRARECENGTSVMSGGDVALTHACPARGRREEGREGEVGTRQVGAGRAGLSRVLLTRFSAPPPVSRSPRLKRRVLGHEKGALDMCGETTGGGGCGAGLRSRCGAIVDIDAGLSSTPMRGHRRRRSGAFGDVGGR